MFGGSGDDYMKGGEGDDLMDGGTGDDYIKGGSGNDYLRGGDGNDTLTGGSGNDVFAFGPNDGNDTITDFDPQEDLLYFPGAEPGDLGVTTEGGNTIITFGDTTITLQGTEMTEDEVLALVQS